MTADIVPFPQREPTRADDERALQLIREAEAAGMHVLFDGEIAPPRPHVSEYLTRPLRTEAQARAGRRPKGLLELIAEQCGIDKAFAKIVGDL